MSHIHYNNLLGSPSMNLCDLANGVQPSQNVSKEEAILKFEAIWLPYC